MPEKQDYSHGSSSRKLAAVLFADIVGYTALMQADEAKASAQLQKFRETLTHSVAKYQGRIGNFYGDGCLAIFDSAVAAVNCAEQVQLSFLSAPEVPVRIGLHSGDVVVKEDNVYGDSVNLASRIEAMAEGGSVLFSERIYRDIKNQSHFQCQKLGAFEFKNVNEPLDIYALANPGLAVPEIKALAETAFGGTTPPDKALWLTAFKWIVLLAVLMGAGYAATAIFSSKGSTEGLQLTNEAKSIAVLPFSNYNNDPDQDYFSEGIANDIRNQLARIKDLKVISRSSSLFYRNKSLPLSQIAEELGVHYILEGTVQKMGDRVKINVELNNAPQNHIAWVSPAYNEEIKDIFFLQAEISNKIVEELKVQLSPDEKARIATPKPVDPEIYNLELQATNQIDQLTPTSIDNAFAIAEEIFTKDSSNAIAHVVKGFYYLVKGTWVGNLTPQEALGNAQFYLEKARLLDPNNPQVYASLGYMKFWLNWDMEGAEEEFQKARELGYSWGAGGLAEIYLKQGRYKEALNMSKLIKELDPVNFYANAWLGFSNFFLGRDEEAFRILTKAIQLTHHLQFYKDLGKLYLNTGDYPQAIHFLQTGMDTFNLRTPAMLGDLAIALYKNGQNQKAQAITAELIELWEEKAGGSPAFFVGQIYSAQREIDKAFEWLEKSYEAHDVEMTWLKLEPQFKAIHGDPRYQDLLRRVGFPREVKD